MEKVKEAIPGTQEYKATHPSSTHEQRPGSNW